MECGTKIFEQDENSLKECGREERDNEVESSKGKSVRKWRKKAWNGEWGSTGRNLSTCYDSATDLPQSPFYLSRNSSKDFLYSLHLTAAQAIPPSHHMEFRYLEWVKGFVFLLFHVVSIQAATIEFIEGEAGALLGWINRYHCCRMHHKFGINFAELWC